MSVEDLDLAPSPEPTPASPSLPEPAAHTPAEAEPVVVADASISDRDTSPTASRLARERANVTQVVALLVALGGAIGPFLLMAVDRQFAFSVPFCGLSLLVSGLGWLALARAFDKPLANVLGSVTARQLAFPALRFGVSLALVIVAIRLAVSGRLPVAPLCAGVLTTASVLWCAIELFRVGQVLGAWRDEQDQAVALLRHHGFWLIALNCLLHLPMLGNFGLIDPWETHYGEVAREILARDDWISLWWAQDGWFWSKPISNFWMQALSFKLFGVGYLPGQMLAGVASGAWPQPEWACRFGVFVLTTLATYSLYKALSRPFGKRTALIGAGILSTCPYWFMLARQTMADMVYAAPLTAAMSLLLLGFQTDPERIVRSLELRFGQKKLWISGAHLVFLVILLSAVPQILYLLSRNLTLHTTAELSGFRLHLDEFMQGSGAGNCGEPGNLGCANKGPLYVWGQPGYYGLLWSVILGAVLWFNRQERRLQRLFFLAAWYATALAVMGKGAPGLVIPLATALVYPVLQARFRDYLRLELPTLFAVLLVVAFPWYVQMYMRHGWPFLDRLIMHDMVRRAFVHVHDTNAGDDVSFRYYVWQLGYGLFPWTGFAGLGLMWLSRGKERAESVRYAASQFLLVWWLLAFGMFTITLTKFHHYILPLVPPTAMLAGVVVNLYIPRVQVWPARAKRVLYAATLFAATLLLLLGAQRFFPGRISGLTPGGQLLPGSPALGGALLAFGLLLSVAGIWLAEKKWGIAGTTETGEASPGAEVTESSRSNGQRNAVLAVVALASAAAVLLAGRDLSSTLLGDTPGQVRLMHLFTYNYTRSWPETLDFQSVYLAFTIVGAALLLGLAWSRVRLHFAVMFGACAFFFAAWVVDVYFVRVSPHWGQRETMLAYYQQRKGDNEPLIAYQMNWKGENFYTSNAMATFVATGAKFKSWIKEQRGKGISTFFITTEHSRISGMKRELEAPESVELVTTKELNDKFVLARIVFPPLGGDAHGDANPSADEPESGDKPGSLE